MINDLIQSLAADANSKRGTGQALAGFASVWDFDPDVIQDADYPALTLDYIGGPASFQRTGGGFDFPFELAATAYTADLEPGAAKRKLRQLMYGGNGRGVMAWIEALSAGYVAVLGRAYKIEVGRVRTGISNLGGTYSAAASVTLTVRSRGR